MAKHYFKIKTQIFELDDTTYTMKAVTLGETYMALTTNTMHEYEFGLSLLSFQSGLLKTLAKEAGQEISSAPGSPNMDAYPSSEEEFLSKKTEVLESFTNTF